MAGNGKPSRTLRMVPLGERGPAFRPEQDYFSVSLVGVYLPGKLLNTSKFAPVVWSSVRHHSPDGERTLVGLFPGSDAARPVFGRNDRVEILDLQLTPRIIAREEMTVDFTLGAVREKDYLGGCLTMLGEIAATPAAAFVSQIMPVAGAIKTATQAAEKLKQHVDKLMDSDKLSAVGRFTGTLRAPMQSGLVAFTDARDDGKGFTWDERARQLTDSKGAVKSAYAILKLQCESARPDWMTLPDLRLAWTRIREAALAGGDIMGAIEFFRVSAVTSPDLTREDAQRLVEATRQKFSGVLSGAESASAMDDPGDLGDALAFFLAPHLAAQSLAVAIGAESAEITPGPFTRSLELILAHEGGFVDHPNDPGGATNKGVTQKTYDDYRNRKGLPKQTVKDISDTEIQEIYFEGYWRAAKCHEMPSEALSLLMFDAAVNHGPGRAIKLLQQAAGCPDADCDGKWGPKTRAQVLAASSNTGQLVEQCLLKREGFYRQIVDLNPKLDVFLRGWMNRIVSLRDHLTPLLALAPAIGDTETALFEDDRSRVPLVAAEPDLSALGPHRAAMDAMPSATVE